MFMFHTVNDKKYLTIITATKQNFSSKRTPAPQRRRDILLTAFGQRDSLCVTESVSNSINVDK